MLDFDLGETGFLQQLGKLADEVLVEGPFLFGHRLALLGHQLSLLRFKRGSQGLDGKLIAERPEPADHAFRALGNIGIMAKALAPEDVGQMHLHARKLRGEQGVEHGDRAMGEGAGIDDQPRRFLLCLLNPGHQLALMIALPEVDGKAQFGRLPLAPRPHVLQGLAAIDLRLPRPEQVQIGTVQDVDRFGHGVRQAQRVSGRAPLTAFPRSSKKPETARLPPIEDR